MKTTILYMAICLCSFFLFSCKKYPEDGKWSKNTVKQRLIHKWQLKECLINGNDSASSIYQIIQLNVCTSKIDTTQYCLMNSILEFRYFKTKVYGTTSEANVASFGIINILNSTANNTCVGTGNQKDYTIIDKKEKIKFSEELFNFSYDIGKTRFFFNLLNNAWDIRKLTDKELILETTNSYNQIVKLKFNRL